MPRPPISPREHAGTAGAQNERLPAPFRSGRRTRARRPPSASCSVGLAVAHGPTSRGRGRRHGGDSTAACLARRASGRHAGSGGRGGGSENRSGWREFPCSSQAAVARIREVLVRAESYEVAWMRPGPFPCWARPWPGTRVRRARRSRSCSEPWPEDLTDPEAVLIVAALGNRPDERSSSQLFHACRCLSPTRHTGPFDYPPLAVRRLSRHAVPGAPARS